MILHNKNINNGAVVETMRSPTLSVVAVVEVISEVVLTHLQETPKGRYDHCSRCSLVMIASSLLRTYIGLTDCKSSSIDSCVCSPSSFETQVQVSNHDCHRMKLT